MPQQERDAQFVEQVAKLLVENPDSVEVNRTIDELGVLITLRVHPNDMATIIGRDGRSAKAIRTLLRIIGAREDQRVNLKIIEPEGAENKDDSYQGESTPVEPSTPVEEQPSAQAQNILDDLPDPIA